VLLRCISGQGDPKMIEVLSLEAEISNDQNLV